jgi:hypothetical protein
MPWEIPRETNVWIDPYKPNVKTEEKLLWFAFLNKWYQIFFKNPYFYIRWFPTSGYGYYCRHKIDDIRVVLADPVFTNTTFLEIVDDIEKRVIEGFGFSSLFEYQKEYFMLIGFWMFANSSKINNSQQNCYVKFEHIYQYKDISNNDVDNDIGNPFRTIVQWEHLKYFQVLVCSNMNL